MRSHISRSVSSLRAGNVLIAFALAALSICSRQVSAQTYRLVVVASFNGLNGATPYAGLMTDGKGAFFGTTNYGGPGYTGPYSGSGAIFSYSAAAGLQTLASFDGSNGAGPQGGLVADGAGNLFGAASGGGANGYGAIYEYSPSEGLQALASFDGANGDGPLDSLIIDGSGALYGVTEQGGAGFLDQDQPGYGSIFKYTSAGGIQTLASFDGVTDLYPVGGLVADGTGALYGTTSGGAFLYGSIFEFSASGGLQSLASFDGTNGQAPLAGMISDGFGNFYGTTSGSEVFGIGAPATPGTIFMYSASGGIQTLASFNGANGSGPTAPLVTDGAGNFYGTTAEGGPDYVDASSPGNGVIFQYSQSGALQVLATFDGANGSMPYGPLVSDGAGDFYGTTIGGGPGYNGQVGSGLGVIFELQRLFNVVGVVNLVGCVDSVQPLTFTLRPSAGAPFTQTVTLAADGSFTLSNIPNGTYTIAIKGASWLQADVQNVVVNGADVANVNATLLPGDANGDNLVDISDFSILASAFGSAVGDANWNPAADFNCDGVVDITDFSLLAQDFGLAGDP